MSSSLGRARARLNSGKGKILQNVVEKIYRANLQDFFVQFEFNHESEDKLKVALNDHLKIHTSEYTN